MITIEPEKTREGLTLYAGPIYEGQRLALRGGDVVTVASLAVAPDCTAFTVWEFQGIYNRKHIQPEDTAALIQDRAPGRYTSTLGTGGADA